MDQLKVELSAEKAKSQAHAAVAAKRSEAEKAKLSAQKTTSTPPKSKPEEERDKSPRRLVFLNMVLHPPLSEMPMLACLHGARDEHLTMQLAIYNATKNGGSACQNDGHKSNMWGSNGWEYIPDPCPPSCTPPSCSCGMIRSSIKGLCLTAAATGGMCRMKACDSTDQNQKWEYDKNKQHLKSSGKCLTARQGDKDLYGKYLPYVPYQPISRKCPWAGCDA